MQYGTVGEILKNGTSKTVIRVTEFKGKSYIDIRDYFKMAGKEEWLPTKKGVSLDVSKISDLCTLIEKAEEQAKGA